MDKRAHLNKYFIIGQRRLYVVVAFDLEIDKSRVSIIIFSPFNRD